MNNSFHIFANETNEQIINYKLDNLLRELSNINIEKKRLDKDIADFIFKYNLLKKNYFTTCLQELNKPKANGQLRTEFNKINEKN